MQGGQLVVSRRVRGVKRAEQLARLMVSKEECLKRMGEAAEENRHVDFNVYAFQLRHLNESIVKLNKGEKS
jgi:hypothetical protein